MLKIRLKRVGRTNDPSFRLVVVPSTEGPKTGNILEVLGSYDPRRDVKEVKADRVKYWISQGAQVSDTVHNILVGEKVIEGKKINVLPKKSAPIKESAVEAPTEEAPAESPVEETSAEETPTEAPVEETSAEETPTEAPVEETPAEEKAEGPKEEVATESSEGEPEQETK